MTGYIALLAVIIVLMIVGFVRARREKMHEEQNKEEQERLLKQKMAELTMPCGELVPSNDELFVFTEEDFDKFSKKDLLWLINYIGHAMAAATDDKMFWERLYVAASNVKNKKHWYTETDHVVDY